MLDPALIEGFEWDDGNRGKNAKHGVAGGDVEQILFREPVLVLPDLRHSDREARYHALGQTSDGRALHVTFTLRGEGVRIRVISARDMHGSLGQIYFLMRWGTDLMSKNKSVPDFGPRFRC